MSKAVFGIYESKAEAERAVEALKADGFKVSDISVLLPKADGAQDFVHTKQTKAPEGATTGASTGAIIGGALGLLAGIGVLAIPGAGPFIAAGPIMAALAGLGLGGAVGGVSGALIGLGVPEYEARRYEGIVNKGGVLLSVHAVSAEWITKAKHVLDYTGAQDIAYTEESRGDMSNVLLRKDTPTDTTVTKNY